MTGAAEDKIREAMITRTRAAELVYAMLRNTQSNSLSPEQMMIAHRKFSHLLLTDTRPQFWNTIWGHSLHWAWEDWAGGQGTITHFAYLHRLAGIPVDRPSNPRLSLEDSRASARNGRVIRNPRSL